MADTFVFFDGSPAAEAEWYDHMPAAMPSGVIGTQAASASTGELGLTFAGLTPTIAAGKANVGGGGFKRSSAAALTAVTANAHASWSRRDRIVLRRSLSTHDVTLVRIQGSAAASPTAPAITRDSTTFDLKLFSFLVPPNSATTVTGIVDERVFIDDGTVLIAAEGSNALLHGSASSTQSIATGGSLKAITLNTEVRATGLTTDTATGKIVAAADGVYLVSGAATFAANTGGRRVVGILLNGTLVDQTQNGSDPDSANSTPVATAAYPIAMVAGDYVQLGAFQSASVSLNVDKARSFLQAHWIGAAA